MNKITIPILINTIMLFTRLLSFVPLDSNQVKTNVMTTAGKFTIPPCDGIFNSSVGISNPNPLTKLLK